MVSLCLNSLIKILCSFMGCVHSSFCYWSDILVDPSMNVRDLLGVALHINQILVSISRRAMVQKHRHPRWPRHRLHFFVGHLQAGLQTH